MDLMDKTPQIQDAPEVIEKYGDAFHPKRENWEPIRGEIEFRDVTFRYPDGGGNGCRKTGGGPGAHSRCCCGATAGCVDDSPRRR